MIKTIFGRALPRSTRPSKESMEMKKRHGFAALVIAAAAALASCSSGDSTATGSGSYPVAAPTTTALATTPSKAKAQPTTTTTKPRPTTTTTVQPPVATQPTQASGVVVIYGAKFKLDVAIWDVFADPKALTARTFVVRKSTCHADDRRFCPGFAVVNALGFANLLPYDPSAKEGGATCRQDDFHNGGLGMYGPRVKVGTTSIAGRPTDHFVQQPCGGNSGTAVHSWTIPGKNVVVFDTDLGAVGALPELIAQNGILSSVR